MQSCNIVLIVSALACEIAKGKTENEISLIGSICSQLGDTLITIAAQKAISSNSTDNIGATR